MLFVWDAWPEGDADASPFLVRHFLTTEAAVGDFGDLVARDAAKSLDQPWYVEAGEPALDDESARVTRMAGAVEQDDRGAHRVPEHDGFPDPERVAKGSHVVRARFEAERRYVAPIRPAVPSEIEVDNLRTLGKRSEVRLEV